MIVARLLDKGPTAVELSEWLLPTYAHQRLRPQPVTDVRMLKAIDALPEDEREAFDLVRIQGMSQAEAAQIVGVSPMTVNRRLNRSLQLLSEALEDLRPT